MTRKRSIIIIEAEQRLAANQAAVSIMNNVADVNTFTVPLSGDGKEPPTHYICSVVLPDDVRPNVMQAMAASAPTAFYWRLSNPDPFESNLEETNVLSSQGKVGELFTSENALSDVDLQRITYEDVI